MGDVMIEVKAALVHPGGKLPNYATVGAAGCDLAAAEAVTLYPGQVTKVPTGLALEIPEGFEMVIRPRSGKSLRSGIRVIQGTIDSDYRGQIHIIAENVGQDREQIKPGDAIAQGVFHAVPRARFLLADVEALSATVRGENGFGHTDSGVK